jgi:UDP-glucose 4-epimerase
MKILVTGSTGFVGKSVCSLLKRNYLEIVLPVREITSHEQVFVGDFKTHIDWSSRLNLCDAVIHLASLVHQPKSSYDDFYSVNVEATINLAKQAAEKGVKRFVYLSSIKVNGDKTEVGQPFRPGSAEHPVGAYAITKSIAEKALIDISVDTGMEVVIIRPPLVYGIGVKGNLNTLLRALELNIPLPFGSIKYNRRSLVYVENLADFILCCVKSKAKLNATTFMVSDNADVSTYELINLLALGLNKKCFLFNVDKRILSRLFDAFGMNDARIRLLESLQVDIKKNLDLLGWTPPYTIQDGFLSLRAKDLDFI